MEAGWQFVWNPYDPRPYFVRSDGSRVYMDGSSYVPYLPAKIEETQCSPIALPAASSAGVAQDDGQIRPDEVADAPQPDDDD